MLRTSSHAFNQHSHWLFLDATEDLFVNAKARVFEPPKKKEKVSKDDGNGAAAAEGGGGKKRSAAAEAAAYAAAAAAATRAGPAVCIETMPKWKELEAILDEIAEAGAEEDAIAAVAAATAAELESDVRNTNGASAERLAPSMGSRKRATRRTVICVNDERTRSQIESYLHNGADAVLSVQLQRYESWKRSANRLTGSGGLLQSKQAAATGGGHGHTGRGNQLHGGVASAAPGGSVTLFPAASKPRVPYKMPCFALLLALARGCRVMSSFKLERGTITLPQ